MLVESRFRFLASRLVLHSNKYIFAYIQINFFSNISTANKLAQRVADLDSIQLELKQLRNFKNSCRAINNLLHNLQLESLKLHLFNTTTNSCSPSISPSFSSPSSKVEPFLHSSLTPPPPPPPTQSSQTYSEAQNQYEKTHVSVLF